MNSTPAPKKPAPVPAKVEPTDAADVEGGKTSIEDPVVSKIAGIATREVDGVYALGGNVARTLGALRGAIGQTDLSQGISVDVGEKQVAVDVSLIVEYPHPVHKVADEVRSSIYRAVESLVGLEVVEVNIAVTDIHIPSDDDVAGDDDSATKSTSSANSDKDIRVQ